MSILVPVSIFVNSVASMVIGAAIIACFPTVREHISDALYRFRTRNDPHYPSIAVCGTSDDDESDWITIGYGKMFRR